VTIISGALEAVGRDSILVFGHRWSLAGVPGAVLYMLGIVGLMLMLTALYIVLPVGQVAFRHALIGGAAATLSWEVIRHALVWYFARLSMVNLVYGSLATAIIVLLTLEAAALILLFGAEVIAEMERGRSFRSG
jgi:YihY family inner membrane protein